MARVAVVTGANRGLGLFVATRLAEQGLRVVMGCRDERRGLEAAEPLVKRGLDVSVFRLDVADEASTRAFCDQVLARFAVDVLVNNAAIYPDEGESVLEVAPARFRATLETNTLGPLLLMQRFVPGMLERDYGRVVNVSSGAGRLSTMTDFAPSYSLSKAALDALTLMVASACAHRNVRVNAVDPGWVRTDMGGGGAPRSIAQGADTILWLATLPDGGPTGRLFHDRREVAW